MYSAAEPNPFLLSFFASNAAAAGFPSGTIALSTSPPLLALRSLPDSSKDAVVACLALSRLAPPSTPQVDALLAEAHRVLKPGGRFYFVDYTARNASDRAARWLQAALSPVTRAVMGGVRVDVPVAQRLATNALGWEAVHLELWGAAQPRRLLVAAQGGEEGVEVEGLQGLIPVVGGVCVKQKAARLSQYVNQSTSLLDELFMYGTVRAPKPLPAAPPTASPKQRGR